MRRALIVALAAMLTLIVAGSVAADNHLPEHPHILVLDAEVDFSGEEPVLLSTRGCIDLANNQRLRLNAQHQHMHFGTAGEALFVHGGHIVIPAAPFPGVPWEDCASFLAFFGLD